MKRLLLLLTFAIFFASTVTAQNSQSYLNDVGSTAYGINIPVENGYINVSNGNLHLEFPLATHPQRGALSLNERIVYDSRIWMFSPFGTRGSYHWWPYNVPGSSTTSGGWRLVTGLEVGTTSYAFAADVSKPVFCQDSGYSGNDQESVMQLIWTDPSGTVHPFNAGYTVVYDPCSGSTTQTDPYWGPAGDGSGYNSAADGNGNPIITDNSGTEVYPSIIDRYGNTFTQDSSGNLIDDTGRVPVITTVNGNTTYYDVLSPNGPIQNQGARVRYTVTLAPISVSTAFNYLAGGYIYEWYSPTLLTPVQSILLPDGSQYTFGYDSYGELNSVTLPTGGVISYGYSNFTDSSYTENRWLTSRQVGTNPPMTFTQTVRRSCTNYSTGCLEYVTVHKPSGDETVYELTLNNGAWNTGVTTYTGAAAFTNTGPNIVRGQVMVTASTISQTTNTNTYLNGCTLFYPCNGANFLSSSLTTTTLFANSSVPGSQTVYEQSLAYFHPTFGKISDQKDWGFTTTSPSTTVAPTSTPTRETQYSYYGNGDPNQITVLDSSGNQAGLTTYWYTTTATPTSGITQHGTQNADGPYLQSVSHWLNTGGNSTTTYTMDDTGMVRGVADANGNPSSVITYQCSNSLPYQSTNPMGQTTQYGYDCSSGAISSVQDPNDLANSRTGTTYKYEQVEGRIYTQTRPDGGVTTYSYPSANEVDTSTTATPSPTITSSTIADSFGRPYKSITAGTEVDTSYDVNGRTNCTTNPYTQGSTTTGSTCISSYDGLDRPLTQTQADGTSTLQWSYSANTTNTTNEVSQTWTRTVDSLGRLTSVVEPGPSGALTTNYSYDGLGNVIKINQLGNPSGGDTARVRTFTYDSASRLICSAQPEFGGGTCPSSATGSIPSGVMSYTYYPAGNTKAMKDARGVTVSYSYDALNRLTNKQSSGAAGIPGFNFTYGYDAINPPVQNGIGRLLYTVNGAGESEIYGYDVMGRMTSESVYLLPASHTPVNTSAVYDFAGNMTDLTYPDGRHIKQTFDGAGRLQTSNLVDINGVAQTQSYLNSVAYNPDGGPHITTLGNGVQQTVQENNRLQMQSLSAAFPVGSAPLQSVLSRTYCYVNCTTGGTANNGNIWGITDALNGTRTQGFTYDNLNRISSFSLGGALSQQYAIDSFGNLSAVFNGHAATTFDPATNRINNLPCAASVAAYDAAGNQICDSDPYGAIRQYTFDAESRVSQIATINNSSSPFVAYTYSANGDRVWKLNSNGTYTQYVNFGGQTIAEKDQTGAFTDYIFAGGRRIAKMVPVPVLHHFGVCGNCNGGASNFTIPSLASSLGGYVIRSGDQLVFSQKQTNARAGLYVYATDGTNSMGNLTDQNGDWINSSSVADGTWHTRVVSLNGWVGKGISTNLGVSVEANTPTGVNWDSQIADIALVSTDGTVHTMLNQQGASGSAWNTSAGSNFAILTSSDAIPETHFYLGDHLGTAQMEFASSGWPVWQGQFAPFGAELDNQNTTNNYKFTGLEHDGESGLDHAQFRQYASTMGRWTAPDPYLGSIDANNPQSLNRYAYVGNMPLSFTDPSGLSEIPGLPGAGGVGGCLGAVYTENPYAAVGCGLFLFDKLLSFWEHPKLKAATNSRPNAQIWDEHGSFHANPNAGIGDLLGISGAGCEFGACGSSFAQGNGPNRNCPDQICIGQAAIYLIQGMSRFFATAYLNPFDRNQRLFGTHYCGPGGGGDEVNRLDGFCHIHDDCYGNFGLDASINFHHGRVITAAQLAGLKGCNQALADGARSSGDDGSDWIVLWLTTPSRFLYPGTEAH